jgi:hypothetical protein
VFDENSDFNPVQRRVVDGILGRRGGRIAAIYDYGVELFRKHAISDPSYNRARDIFGIPAIVELACLMGYYGMVAMTLLAHQMPLQQDAVILQDKVSGK